jgi:hypothetical protein
MQIAKAVGKLQDIRVWDFGKVDWIQLIWAECIYTKNRNDIFIITWPGL